MQSRSRRRSSIAWTLMLALALVGSGIDGAAPAATATITLDVQNRSLRDVLARIGARFDVSIVSGSELRANVTVSLRDLSLDEALRAVLEPIGATFRRSGRIIFIERGTVAAAQAVPVPVTARKPVALAIQAMSIDRATAIVHRFYPGVRVESDHATRTLLLDATPAEADSIHALVASIDVPDPTRHTTEAINVVNANPATLVAKIHGLFPGTTVTTGPNRTLLVDGNQADRTQIKALVAQIDTPPQARPVAAVSSDAIRVTQVRATDAARAVSGQLRSVRANAVGDSVVLSGPPDDVARAKTLVALIDVPAALTRYTSIYKLRFVDAKSVQALIARTFPDAQTSIDGELNVLSVLATGAQHARIAQAIAQLDAAPAGGPVAEGSAAPGAVNASAGGAPYQVEIVNLKAAIPNAAAGTPSTTTTDLAATVQTTLATVAPDLHLTPVPNQPQLIVSGSPYSVKIAKELIGRIDTPQKLVVLDTQILEVNETVAKNLGLSFGPNSVVTSTYAETTPQPNAAGVAVPLLGLQPLSRTPLSLQFQLGLAISQGKGRILADPRITTLSGKTASIRAGDNLTVLTQSGGGTGVAVTTQLQTFNTGVSLDITPIVNEDNYVTINLHPVVNNVSSISSAGIPQISTRDTQTTIGIKEGQTLVIGGLIQDNSTRTTTKIPILGDLPVIGPAFRNQQVNNSRDELIITITPHIIDPLKEGALIPLPPPAPLPTSAGPYRSVLPGATFPPIPGSTPRPSPSPTLGPISVYGTAPQSAVAAPAAALTAPPLGAPAAGPAAASNANAGSSFPVSPLGALPFPIPGGSGSPQPQASAFASTNVFTYGSAPANNYAGPTDNPQIFFATFTPTVLRNGTTVSVSAVTTSNVNKVTIGFQGSSTTPLSMTGTGKWQATYPFSTAGMAAGQTTIPLTLTASRSDGTSAVITIPVSLQS